MTAQSSTALGESLSRYFGTVLLGFGIVGSCLTLFSAVDAIYPWSGTISTLIASWRMLTSDLWNAVIGAGSSTLPAHYVAACNFLLFMGSIAFRGWQFWPPTSGPRPTLVWAAGRTMMGALLLAAVWSGYLLLWQSALFTPVARIFVDSWAARHMVTYWALAAAVYAAFVTPIGLAAAAPFLRRTVDVPPAIFAGGAYTVMLTCIFALPTVASGPVSPWSDPIYAAMLATTYLIGLPLLFMTSAIPGAARQLLLILIGVGSLWALDALSVVSGLDR